MFRASFLFTLNTAHAIVSIVETHALFPMNSSQPNKKKRDGNTSDQRKNEKKAYIKDDWYLHLLQPLLPGFVIWIEMLLEKERNKSRDKDKAGTKQIPSQK